MPTVVARNPITDALHAQREADFERYKQNQRFEEKTDIGERLGYHIDTTIHYELREGAAYCLSDTKRRAFHEQTLEALEAGRWKFTGSEAFEYVRLHHEHQEALDVDALMRGELGANVMVKISKVPDAVVAGTTTISGYRRDLLRSFVRVYATNGDGRLQCRLFTLDGNDEQGFQRVEDILGIQVTGRGSEDILGDRALFTLDDRDLDEAVALLAESTKHAYDKGVFEATGKKTYAGSVFTDQLSALARIDMNNDLFEEHYRELQQVAVQVLGAQDKETRIETLRRQTAAAIKLRTEGHTVTSVSDSAVTHEATTGEYGRECATGMNQSQSEQELARDWVQEVRQCPICGAKNVTARKQGEIIEGVQCGCTANVCTGESRRGSRLSTAATRHITPSVSSSPEHSTSTFMLYSNYATRRKHIKERFGEDAEEHRVKGIGTEYIYVRDRSGEIIAQL